MSLYPSSFSRLCIYIYMYVYMYTCIPIPGKQATYVGLFTIYLFLVQARCTVVVLCSQLGQITSKLLTAVKAVKNVNFHHLAVETRFGRGNGVWPWKVFFVHESGLYTFFVYEWFPRFPMICGCRGSKSRLAKAAGAEPSGQMRDEKVHAVVARSTFPTQNVQNTSCSDHFWKLRCRKSARRCGAKHISKSKCTKHTRSGALLEVEMMKSARCCWRKAHFDVKMYKAPHVGATFQASFCVSGARDSAPCQK